MPQEPPTPRLVALSPELADPHPEPYRSLRRDALDILDAALAAVQPDNLLDAVLSPDGLLAVEGQRYNLGRGEDVTVLVTGKGSPGFARVARERLPQADGLVIGEAPGDAGDWPWLFGEHPVPDEGSVNAGQAALELVQRVPEDGTLLVLITGGASALMEVPSIPLDDLALTTQTLLDAGVTVTEMNMLRKHLSEIKGGRLAAACPGRVITLGISDVPHDVPSDLGSGPTVPDPTTFKQALALVERLGEDNLPPVVVEHVRKGANGDLEETPSMLADNVYHHLATNKQALAAAEERAKALGHRTRVLPSPMEGEARVVGETMARRLVAGERALLAGGETTVSLRPAHEGGPGDGGRNQELTLAAALHLSETPAVVCGFGTDGVDGPTDAAGAIADGRTLTRAADAGLDPKEHLDENHAYGFFSKLDDLIITGPTGTNVMDLFIGLVQPEE